MTLNDLLKLLASCRCDLSDEKRAQRDVAATLSAHDVEYSREYRLSGHDIVDFLIAGDIAVEIKLKGARKRAVYSQLERYAAHDCVHVIVLMTNLSMGLPQEINGKPTHYISMGKAWL